MPDPVKITDHVQQAKDRLRTQFRDSPKLNALLESIVIEVQLSEDVIFQVILLRLLDNATGVNLDIIGKIVGRARLGVTDDDEYRELLRVQIRANQSDCGAEDVIYVASELLGVDIRYTQTTAAGSYIAHFHLEAPGAQGVTPDEMIEINRMIELVACSGVSWELVTASATNAFTYNSGPGYNVGEYGRGIGGQGQP